MKKYFMKGTSDEVKFGDMIVLDLTEDKEDGKVLHHHLDCKFVPDLIPMLLEQEVIEEVSEGEDEETIDDCPLVESHNALVAKVEQLEDAMTKMAANINDIAVSLKHITEHMVSKSKKDGGK